MTTHSNGNAAPQDLQLLRVYVLLTSTDFPGDHAIFSQFQQFDSELPPVEDVRHENESTVFALGEDLGTLTLHPEPLSAELLEETCQQAWYWPEAAETVTRHTATVEITLMGPKTWVLERHAVLSYLAAAVMELCETVGAYWEGAPLVQSSEDFLSQAEEITPEGMPLMLWIHFGMYQDEQDSLTLATRGMSSFGQLEIEVRRFHLDPPVVLDLVFEVAHYLLLNGPVLSNGSVIEISDKERARVSLVTSLRDENRPCMLLEFEGEHSDEG